MNRRRVVNLDAFPETFAGFQEPLVVLATGLVVFVVFQTLEMKRQREVEGMIGDWSACCGRWPADEAMDEIRDFFELDKLILKNRALVGGEFLFKPKEDIMNHRV